MHTSTFQLLDKPWSQVSSLLPPVLAFNFIAHRVQQTHCSSIFHRLLLTQVLALSASQFVHKKKSPRIYASCCCSHINSHNQVRGHRKGSSYSGAAEYPREKHKQPKVVHAYITADAIHASTRNIYINVKSGVSLRCARSIPVRTSHYSRLEKPIIPLATQEKLPPIYCT